MSRDQVSSPELAALGRFQGSIERNANFRQQAFNHNLGRNVRVAKLLGYVGILRQAGTTFSMSLECVRASRQNFSSSQSMTNLGLPTGPMQAAHFIPGQILIGSRPVWDWAENRLVAEQIEFLFAEVEHLPVPFNQADTEAEDKGTDDGLCAALVAACRVMIAESSPDPASSHVPRKALEAAWKEWHTRALIALQSAAAAKRNKPGLPPLVGNPFEGYDPELIAARSNPKQSEWNRDEAIRVLDYYIEDQQQRSWAWVETGCRTALGEVESWFTR